MNQGRGRGRGHGGYGGGADRGPPGLNRLGGGHRGGGGGGLFFPGDIFMGDPFAAPMQPGFMGPPPGPGGFGGGPMFEGGFGSGMGPPPFAAGGAMPGPQYVFRGPPFNSGGARKRPQPNFDTTPPDSKRRASGPSQVNAALFSQPDVQKLRAMVAFIMRQLAADGNAGGLGRAVLPILKTSSAPGPIVKVTAAANGPAPASEETMSQHAAMETAEGQTAKDAMDTADEPAAQPAVSAEHADTSAAEIKDEECTLDAQHTDMIAVATAPMQNEKAPDAEPVAKAAPVTNDPSAKVPAADEVNQQEIADASAVAEPSVPQQSQQEHPANVESVGHQAVEVGLLLSRVKGEFRSRFDRELDNKQLGVHKLIDFVQSTLSDLCHIRTVKTDTVLFPKTWLRYDTFNVPAGMVTTPVTGGVITLRAGSLAEGEGLLVGFAEGEFCTCFDNALFLLQSQSSRNGCFGPITSK